MFAFILTNSNVDTNYYLYEMSDAEVLAFDKQITNKLKMTWNQTRSITTSLTGEVTPLPWDDEDILTADDKRPYTPEEIEEQIRIFQETSNY